jgi:hypothetical protein
MRPGASSVAVNAFVTFDLSKSPVRVRDSDCLVCI